MADETKVAETVSELKSADEEKLREVVEKWFESTRTDGIRIGASMISTAVYAIIKKHLVKTSIEPDIESIFAEVDAGTLDSNMVNSYVKVTPVTTLRCDV